MSDEVVQGTGAYLTLAVESLESQLTAAEATMREAQEEADAVIDSWRTQCIDMGATMREVAEELRAFIPYYVPTFDQLTDMADRLSPPPVEEKKTCPHPKACWGEMVCLSGEGGGQWCDVPRLDPPPVVENPSTEGARDER